MASDTTNSTSATPPASRRGRADLLCVLAFVVSIAGAATHAGEAFDGLAHVIEAWKGKPVSVARERSASGPGGLLDTGAANPATVSVAPGIAPPGTCTSHARANGNRVDADRYCLAAFERIRARISAQAP